MAEYPSKEEIRNARSVLSRANALKYWEKLRDNPEKYKQRLIKVREASKIAAQARKKKI